MSEENEGEEKQNDTSEQEFQFYFSFTKPLVLELPTEEERALAAAWVQKLEEPKTTEEKQERLNYLKLLLFVLQRGRLGGIFASQPPSGPLQPFPQGFSVLDMGNLLLEQDEDLLYGGGDAGHIPYVTELSNDLREYVASQEIPNFGVQMYYAWSANEPVNKWSLFDEEKFPKYILDKIKQMKSMKYDEKSQAATEGCELMKKGCNFSLPEILSSRKVKSPEEIEKSQGRSFLTYMGLVGRMGGNCNEKCDEDSERPLRQPLSRKCSAKRKKCPGSGVDDGTGEEDFDNFVSGIGGEMNMNMNMNTNRPCLCPSPLQQTNCPTQQPKKRQQTSCVESQPIGNCSDGENVQWTNQAARVREPRFDSNMTGSCGIPQQRNASPRNNSLSRRGADCFPEGNSGGFPANQGEVCVCTNPPCTCPCPRGPKPPPQKAPQSGNGGRVCQSPRPARQEGADCNLNRNRGIGTYLTSFNAPDPCTPTANRPDLTPTGGRTCEGSNSLRPVAHCYDHANPDPTLTKTLEKNDNWMPLMDGGVKYIDTDYKIACNRDQMIASAMENKCTIASRKTLFSPAQPGPSGMNRMRPQNDYPQQTPGSPGLLTHPLCDYSPPMEEESFTPQPCPTNFGEYQGGRSPQPQPQVQSQMYPSCSARVNTNTQKKSQTQSSCRAKSAGPPGGPFAVSNDAGRLANMANVLRGMKQKTEGAREKCTDTPRPPDNYCMGGGQGQTQPKPCSRQNEPRTRGPGYGGGGNEPMGRNMMSGCGGYQPPPPTPQGPRPSYSIRAFENFCNTLPNKNLGSPVFPPEAYDFSLYKSPFAQDERCEPCYEEEEEDEDECDSSGSLEEPCQNKVEDRQFKLSEPCQEALSRRQQDYYKLTYGVESAAEPQECLRNPSFPQDNDPYSGLSSTPECFGTMQSANDSNCPPQWASPRRGGMKTQNPSSRVYADVPTECDERTVGTVGSSRVSPGRASQRISSFNDTPTDGSNPFDDTCSRIPGNRNRYFERSAISHTQAACGRPNPQPVCSTPLRHHRETFKDRRADDLSAINR